MTKKNRILAFAAAIVILMSCLFAAVFSVSAQEDVSALNESGMYISSQYLSSSSNQGAVPYPYTSWASMLSDYNAQSGGTCYYFRSYVGLPGTEFYSAPSQGLWFLPYQYDTNSSITFIDTRFYVPYRNGLGWECQAYTSLGNLIFDTTNKTLIQDPNNPEVGYYQVSFNSNSILGFNEGWYLYSLYEAPPPPSPPVYFDVTFNYYHESTLVGTNVISALEGSSQLQIPPLADYVIESVSPGLYYSEGIQTGRLSFTNGISSNLTVNVYVISLSSYISDLVEDGRQEGYTSGYVDGLEVGYDQGYLEGFEAGQDTSDDIPNFLGVFFEPVAQFLAIEPFPGLPIGIMFVAAVAISLVVIFLKIFAGG